MSFNGFSKANFNLLDRTDFFHSFAYNVPNLIPKF